MVVDIGLWTIDIMPVIDKRPDDSRCSSVTKGLITCMRDIERSFSKSSYGGEIHETDIEYYVMHGTLPNAPESLIDTIDKHLQEYADMVLRVLREQGENVNTTPIIFVGGGAGVMKRYCSHKIPIIQYNLDVKANAKGYAMLARIAQRNAKR